MKRGGLVLQKNPAWRSDAATPIHPRIRVFPFRSSRTGRRIPAMAFSLWNSKSRYYRGMRKLPFVQRMLEREREALRKLVRSAPDPPERVLDLGTGTGDTLSVYPSWTKLTGMDRSPAMMRRCKLRFGINGVAGDAGALPFRSGSAKWISAVGLTEYLKQKEAFLEDVRRVLSPGGYFLVTLSPPGVINALRTLLGHKIHALDPGIWESMLREHQFDILAMEKTSIQKQYLCCRHL